MASQIAQQFGFRAQKSLGLINGTPDYTPVHSFQPPEGTARTYQYSKDGRLFGYALPTCVRIFQAETAQLVLELTIPNIVELNFSPRGTYLSTWERPVKFEDGTQHKNLRVFSTSSGEELIAFSQKPQEAWDLQYTGSESHAIRLVGQEVQVYHPATWERGIVDKLRIEGATAIYLSPGLNPSVAVFIGEKKGAPGSVKIYSLLSLTGQPTCQKTFFKADRCQVKWNDIGTQVLVLTQTEVDNTNKSYYGETNLYLLTSTGNFDCRVTLDKEGPIHDFAWSPNSKEFGVVYGFMPAKTILFDHRVKILHDFGSAPHNFISFNPQARLIALAGFGNLAGKVDIFDRRTLNKVCTLSAPNTSHFEWSPDGRFIMTATLSPRLRVDNGIKVWHCTGPLLHVQSVDELYQTSWRPTPADALPPFPGNGLPVAPAPSASVTAAGPVASPAPVKPAGAYRPPGARGLATPTIFKREDEGGAAYVSGSGHNTPSRNYSRSPVPGAPPPSNGHQGQNGVGRGGRRHVPGAPPLSPPPIDGGEGKKGKKKKDKKKDAGGGADGSVPTSPVANGHPAPPVVIIAPVEEAAPDPSLDPVQKKIRNLNKKLKAIDELKEKAKRGDRLEATQVKKIEAEGEIRKELETLAVS